MIDTAEMLTIFQHHRGDAIVVPGRAAHHWMRMSTRPQLDLPFGDPAMGGHASFAFGLALGKPDRKVVLFDSEGDVLMSMGILPTIAEHRPRNFYHFMLDNECYATTGGQPVPNARNIAYDGIARCAGYAHCHAYADIKTFADDIGRVLGEPGPAFVALKVLPEIRHPADRHKRWVPPNRRDMLANFRKELGIAD